MKLCEFEKVNACCYTDYSIKKGDDIVDYFSVDYMDDDQTRLDESILKRKTYDQATVVAVSALYPKHGLSILVRI